MRRALGWAPTRGALTQWLANAVLAVLQWAQRSYHCAQCGGSPHRNPLPFYSPARSRYETNAIETGLVLSPHRRYTKNGGDDADRDNHFMMSLREIMRTM
jgi:hypothetical protein